MIGVLSYLSRQRKKMLEHSPTESANNVHLLTLDELAQHQGMSGETMKNHLFHRGYLQQQGSEYLPTAKALAAGVICNRNGPTSVTLWPESFFDEIE